MVARHYGNVAAVVAMAICAGCYPAPHTEWSRPEISGRYAISGRPASGIEVLLGHGADKANRCAGLEKVAVTDRNGKFHVDPETHVAWLRDAINGDYVAQLHHLCFRDPRGTILASEFDTWKTSYEHVYLSCNAPPVQSARPFEPLKVCYSTQPHHLRSPRPVQR